MKKKHSMYLITSHTSKTVFCLLLPSIALRKQRAVINANHFYFSMMKHSEISSLTFIKSDDIINCC